MAKTPKNTEPKLPAFAALNDPENPTIDAAVKPVESEVIDAKETAALAKPALPKLELGGVYKVKHGSYKLGEKLYAAGSTFRLSHNDALLGLLEGVIEAADAETKARVAENDAEIKTLYDGRHKYESPLAVQQDVA